MSFDPSIVRRALDHLLDAYPSFDLVSVDWQLSDLRYVTETRKKQSGPMHLGPWMLVTLGQPSESFDQVPAWALWRFAIFKRTGALHTMQDGAVSDDPIWTP